MSQNFDPHLILVYDLRSATPGHIEDAASRSPAAFILALEGQCPALASMRYVMAGLKFNYMTVLWSPDEIVGPFLPAATMEGLDEAIASLQQEATGRTGIPAVVAAIPGQHWPWASLWTPGAVRQDRISG